MSQKSVLAIHDVSCFGRCSLTVALPLLSAAGIQTSVLPTAVLSTHTGGFRGNTFRDLTNDIEPIVSHWKEEGIGFDAVYSGYLCSESQVFSVISAIETIKRDDTLVIVDPVIGDNGKNYSGFTAAFPEFMIKLCKKADIITPNLTEACLLTGTEYKEGVCEKAYIEELLSRLYELTNAKIVLTGVCLEEKRIGSAVYDEGEISYAFTEKLAASYHSTGDIFASVLTASILSGRSLKAATQIAVNFTAACIRQTMEDGTDERNGVSFETQIETLIKYLKS